MTPRYCVAHAWAQNTRGGRYVVYDLESRKTVKSFRYKKELGRGVAHGRANLMRDKLNQENLKGV